jgi:Flp pilus assembly protein CpaB
VRSRLRQLEEAVLVIVAAVLVLSVVLVIASCLAMAKSAEQEDHEQIIYRQIVVAAADMSPADTVVPRHVRLMPWLRTAVPEGAFESLWDVRGRVAQSAIVAGEPLVDGKPVPCLADTGRGVPVVVPEGRHLVAVSGDDAVRDPDLGFVPTGSRDDVLGSVATTKTCEDRMAKVILHDGLVLAAEQTVELEDKKPGTITTVTLSLTPEHTARLATAQAEVTLTLAMRGVRDARVVRTPEVTPISG